MYIVSLVHPSYHLSTTMGYRAVCLLLLSAFLGVTTADEDKHLPGLLAKCDLLEQRLGNYIQSTAYYNNVLYDLMGFQLDLDSSFLQYLKEKSGFDLQDPQEIRRFACTIAGVNNRYQLGQALHFHLSEIDYFYMAVLAPIKDVGGMDNVKLIAKIYIMLFSWADQSGYPVLPIKNINDQETLRVYQTVRDAMRDDSVRRHVTGQPFPVNMSPEDALKLIKGAKTYEELEDAMELNEETLADWAWWVKNDPGSIKAGVEDIRATITLLKAFDATGLLKLQ